MVHPRHHTAQGQLVAKPGKLLRIVLSLSCKSDIKELFGNYISDLCRPTNWTLNFKLQLNWNRDAMFFSCKSAFKNVTRNVSDISIRAFLHRMFQLKFN